MTSPLVKPRFPWRIFRRFVAIQTLLVLAALFFSGVAGRHFFEKQFLAQVEAQTHDLLRSLSHDLPQGAIDGGWCRDHAEGTAYRITVIEAAGKVLCDSHHDPESMENHALRPEVLAANREGFGQSIRHSATIDQDMLYGALPVGGSGLVLRGAIPLAKLSRSLTVFDASLAGILVVLAAALAGLAAWAGRRLLFPVGRILLKSKGLLGPDEEELGKESFDEWSDLESSIDDIRRDLALKAESLTREREELGTLMSAISDAILAVDTEGTPLFYNSRFAVMFHRDKATRLWEMFRQPEVLDAFKTALQDACASAVRPFEIVDEMGARRYFSLSVSPLRRKEGPAYGAVGIFHDVTELKRAEQIRIDFVANVSHELRTPLTAIKGYTDTLLLDVSDNKPVEPEFLDRINRNATRLMNLINDLLDLSSLESVEVLHPSQVSTEEISSRVIRQLQNGFDAKKQEVRAGYGVRTVFADARRLEQVLVNLLDNAQKYTPAGGKVELSWDAEPSGDVVLRVKDNGPGIPAEHHSRLFERFYRVDKARSREQGGTGLGLSIVKHILQRHGGSVWVESQVGQGTTFVCRFPGERAGAVGV